MQNSIKLTKFTQILIRNLPLNPGQLKRKCLLLQHRSESTNADADSSDCKPKSCAQRQYNTPHPPKDPPENFTPTVIHQGFEGPDNLPYAIFRPFDSPCDTLGPGAHKCGLYKNAEYYSYHRYSFVEIQRCTLLTRQEGIQNDGARLLYDYDSSNEDEKDTNKQGSSSSSSSEDSGSDGECSK